MNRLIGNIAGAVTVLACVAVILHGGYKIFLQEQALWHKENKCIAIHVAQEVERKDIYRDGEGGCYVSFD